MISGNFEDIFQLIKDGITKENFKVRELEFAVTIAFLSTGRLCKNYFYEYYSFYSTMKSLTFSSFGAFVFSIFLFLIMSFHKDL